MSRPQKIVPPIKATFNSILTSVAIGSGKAKRAALKLAREAAERANEKNQSKKP
jgi:hypothetical protein